MRAVYPLSDVYMRKRAAFSLFLRFDVLDDDNRPILEGRSKEFILSNSDLRHCSYPDSRENHDKKMNIGALVQLRSQREPIKKHVVSLIKAMGVGNNASLQPTLQELWHIAYAFRSFAHFEFLLDYQKLGFAGKSLESGKSSLYKVSLGILDTISNALIKGRSAKEVWSAEDFYNYADKHGRLVGLAEVCAAPKKLFISFLEDLISCFRVASSADNDIDLGYYKRLGSFADTQWKINVFAFTYNVLRQVRARQSMSPGDGWADARHTTPYDADARTAASNPDPLTAAVCRPFMELDLNNELEDETVSMTLTRFLNEASSLLKSTKTSSVAEANIDTLALRFLQTVENFVRGNIGLTGTYIYSPVDLVHFFGSSID